MAKKPKIDAKIIAGKTKIALACDETLAAIDAFRAGIKHQQAVEKAAQKMMEASVKHVEALRNAVYRAAGRGGVEADRIDSVSLAGFFSDVYADLDDVYVGGGSGDDGTDWDEADGVAREIAMNVRASKAWACKTYVEDATKKATNANPT